MTNPTNTVFRVKAPKMASNILPGLKIRSTFQLWKNKPNLKHDLWEKQLAKRMNVMGNQGSRIPYFKYETYSMLWNRIVSQQLIKL